MMRGVKPGQFWGIIGMLLAGCIGLLFLGATDNETEPEVTNEPELHYVLPDMPESVLYCEEDVPIHLRDVKESLEREMLTNAYWHSQTIQILKRANRYFPEIEKILREEGVPEDLKYLTLAESALLHAVSPAGATGFWQLLKGTAQDYNLEINKEVDERYHLEKSTRVAAQFLRDSYEEFGSWSLAAASYNVGRRGVKRQLERQKEDDYYNLLFNTETGRYVYRAIAFKIMVENPQQYGFKLSPDDYYPPFTFKTISVNSAVPDFATFAHEHGTNYKVLKLFNPWLRESYLTNAKGKTYEIRIPKRGSGYAR